MTNANLQLIDTEETRDASIELDSSMLEHCRGGSATPLPFVVPAWLLELGQRLDNERRSIALVGGVHGGTLAEQERQNPNLQHG